MRRARLTLPMLISFNELAWIAVFAFALLYSTETTRLAAERDASDRERNMAKRENEEGIRQRTQMQKEIERLRRIIVGVAPNGNIINQQLIGLNGNLQRVVMIVDRSGSMKQGRKWEYTRSIIKTWLEYLPIEQCALITFSNEAEVFPSNGTFLDMLSPVGKDNRTKLLKQFDLVSPEGDTNTLSALQKAYAYPDLDTIILFTDGFPDNGSNTFDTKMAEEIYALCQEHGHSIPINTIGLGNYFNPRLGEFLLCLPEITGGTFLGR
ncbi:MAG: VWA domain-containing protein [Acidobacteria bacterium]|nr:VWA domain-containing protein [Acidobacteriota bacterium]